MIEEALQEIKEALERNEKALEKQEDLESYNSAWIEGSINSLRFSVNVLESKLRTQAK